MDAAYQVADTRAIISPGLVVFHEVLERNVQHMIELAGDVARLRPHCKTHKMREVIGLQMARGIARHKCATLAEAEMLAGCGVRDILLAYQLVGPNIGRAINFVQRYPEVRLSVTVDHSVPARQLSEALVKAGSALDVLLDLDTGQHRTGLPMGETAEELYGELVELPGVQPDGLHVYDGQNHQTNVDERASAVNQIWRDVVAFRGRLQSRGWPVPRIVAGGTGSFPIYARHEDDTLELSPGTVCFFDAGYGHIFPDLGFTPAALLLTRVISVPTADRVTFDLGYKAVASDPPPERRVRFPDLPDARIVLQNEEHLVVETPAAGRLQPGDEVWAVPWHICPTSALHKQVFVVRGGKLQGRWDVAARDRWLEI